MSDESLRRDELVSAYLDGEATPAEVAEIERDDALPAHVEELRAVRDAVAAPVPALSAEQRCQMISAALGVAEAEADARMEAKVVPLRRRRPLFLAVAAAVLLLAAAVSAGLLGSRGSDDAEMTAAGATMADSAAPAAEMAAEEPMAEADTATADEAMMPAEATDAEEPMAGEPTAEAEFMVEEAIEEAATEAEAMVEEAIEEAATEAEAMVEEGIKEAAAEAEAMEAPAAAAPVAIEADPEPTSGTAETEEERRSESTADASELGGGGSPGQVVDLGMLENLESLHENIGAKWSAAPEDEAMADPGACSAAVDERALEMSAETRQSFVATVGAEDPLSFDAQFVRRPDGSALVIYAAPPDCEIKIHELAGS